MFGKEINKILNLGALHALYREDGSWYHHLELFPGILFDRNGYVTFESKSDYLNHPDLNHGKDLHIKQGISSMRGYILFSDEQKNKLVFELREFDEESIRLLRQVNLIIRNRELIKKIKKKYSNTCQICGVRLEISKNCFYSEIHHIKPLGNPHNGPDKFDNMMCVCPNCHVLLDLRALAINVENLKILRHPIKEEYIAYHNNLILSINN